jgi:hypothetical protein
MDAPSEEARKAVATAWQRRGMRAQRLKALPLESRLTLAGKIFESGLKWGADNARCNEMYQVVRMTWL